MSFAIIFQKAEIINILKYLWRRRVSPDRSLFSRWHKSPSSVTNQYNNEILAWFFVRLDSIAMWNHCAIMLLVAFHVKPRQTRCETKAFCDLYFRGESKARRRWFTPLGQTQRTMPVEGLRLMPTGSAGLPFVSGLLQGGEKSRPPRLKKLLIYRGRPSK